MIDLEHFLLEFEDKGFYLAEGLIAREHAQELRDKILQMSAKESAAGQAYIYPHDPNAKTQRIWNLTNKHKCFRDLLEIDSLYDALNKIFQRPTEHPLFFLSSFQANILYPGACQQKLHIDTPFPEPLPPWPARVNSIWLLDSFDSENGATEVVPGTHKNAHKPSKEDNAEITTIPICGSAGSVLITHGNLWHRSGSNTSDQPRVALLACFAASYMREIANEEDLSLSVSREVKDSASPRLRSILGLGHGLKAGYDFQH